jgi:hypothetical protein
VSTSLGYKGGGVRNFVSVAHVEQGGVEESDSEGGRGGDGT